MIEYKIKADGTLEKAIVPNEALKEPTLDELKSLAMQYLEETDYKIVKCMECFLLGEELPYDLVKLRQERQDKRNIINTPQSEE